jgi:hypothetical protein
MYITVVVRAIKTAVQTNAPTQVIKGSQVVITITYLDTDHGDIGISDANFTILSGLEGVNSTYYKIQELGNGQYRLILNTSWIPDDKLPESFDLTLSLGKGRYSSQVESVSFKVVFQGVSSMLVVYAGGGSGGAVIIVLLGYVMYRRAKKPFIIKKIEQSLKLISKGEQVEPIEGLKNRNEIPLSLLTADLETLGVKVKKEEPKPEEKKEEKIQQKKHEKKRVEQEKKNKDTKKIDDKKLEKMDTTPEEASKDAKTDSGGSLEN